DVRGTPPTDVEEWFFVSDDDNDKRAKVVDWMIDDEKAKLALAKKFGVPPERIKIVRTRVSADGKTVELYLADSTKPTTLAFTPDDKLIAAGTADLAAGVLLNQNAVPVLPLVDATPGRPFVVWTADGKKAAIDDRVKRIWTSEWQFWSAGD